MRTTVVLGLLVLAPSAFGQPATPAPASRPGGSAAARVDHGEVVRGRIESVLKQLADDQRYDRAAAALDLLLDEAIAYTPAENPGLLIDAAFARRLVGLVGAAEEGSRREVLKYLRKHEALARHLVFLVQPGDDRSGVVRVLDELRGGHGDALAELPALAAALCVVHDRPLPLSVSTPEREQAADASALFAFYRQNRSRMLFDPGSLPGELLIYVVDSRAGVDELNWALSRHGGDRNVGKRYHDLTYDTANYKYNKPKKISQLPYTLQNLRKVGGVCEEQAYYASHVAKAIGAPSAVIAGRRADVGHAWVAFLQRRGSSTAYNCDEGQIDEYEKARGETIDPQTRRRITQSQLELTAALLNAPEQRRWGAVALLDAAERLSRARTGGRWPPPPSAGEPRTVVEKADTAAQIRLMERACELSPNSPQVWLAAAKRGGQMQNADRDRFFRGVSRACAGTTPDFAYLVTSELIGSMEPSPGAVSAWDWLSKQYTTRPDLTGEALIRKADVQFKLGERNAAYETLQGVITKSVNDGPFVLAALSSAETMLLEGGRPGLVADLWRDAFRRCSRPSNISAGYFRTSNYYRIGHRAAEALREAGRENEAQQIRRQLKAAEPKD
jgi:hypothetical protein